MKILWDWRRLIAGILLVTTAYYALSKLANRSSCVTAGKLMKPKEGEMLIGGRLELIGVNSNTNWLLDKKMSTSIPRILHYVFKNELPFESYKQMIRTCLELNPDWTVYLWRDSDSMRLIRENYKYFEKKYIGYKDRLEKSDSVRYMILHRFGGIYLDMDVECLKPFDQLLQMRSISSISSGAQADGISAFLGEERREQTRILYGYSFCTMNSLMGSSPGHPFFQFVINRMLSVPDLNHARLSTGPDFLSRTHMSWLSCADCQQNQHQVVIFPARFVSPIMDTSLVNWETKCSWYLRTNPGSSLTKAHDEASLTKEQESWRRLGCAELVAKGWSFDDTDNATVAVHRFTHQGYGDQEGKKSFNLINVFPRIKTFYARK